MGFPKKNARETILFTRPNFLFENISTRISSYSYVSGMDTEGEEGLLDGICLTQLWGHSAQKPSFNNIYFSFPIPQWIFKGGDTGSKRSDGAVGVKGKGGTD